MTRLHTAPLPEVSTDDPAADHCARMEAIHERDKVWVSTVKMESRTAMPALLDAGVMGSETFVFSVQVEGTHRHTASFSIMVTEESARACALQAEGAQVDMLVTAWSELATIGDHLHVAACQGGGEAYRRAENMKLSNDCN